MNSLAQAVATEFLKTRRSKVPWSVAAGFSLAPLVAGLFMVILKDPDRARQLGLMGAKAQLAAGVAVVTKARASCGDRLAKHRDYGITQKLGFLEGDRRRWA